MKKPKISVLMTIYNHQNYLKNSIISILNQNYSNWELIAIDNGSTDKSRKVLKSFKDKRIKKIFLKKNIGRTNCLNYGLDFCKGEFVAIQDSDDVALRGRLKKQFKYFDKFKNLSLVSSNFQIIDERNKIKKKKYMNYKNINYRDLIFKNIIAHSTVMYRKNLIPKIGKYPKRFLYAQDYAFYLKVFKNYKIYISNENVLKARIHSNSEGFRLSKTKTIVNEQIRLLIWSLKNLDPSTKEKIILISKYFFLKLKKFFRFLYLIKN